MAELWYYRVFGQEFGPVPIEHLRNMLTEGAISLADRVRAEHESRLIMLSEALETESDPASFAADLNAVLSIDDFVIEGRAQEMPERRGPQAPDVPEEPDIRYYVRSHNTTIGPLSPEDLCRLAEAGKISSDDCVRKEDEDWMAAADCPEVMAAQMVMAVPAGSNIADLRQSRGERVKRRDHREHKSGNGVRAPTSRQAAAKKKRRRKRTVDSQLEDIFDEVFGSDGRSNFSGAGAQKTAAPTQSVATTAPQPAPASAASTTAVAGNTAFMPATADTLSLQSGQAVHAAADGLQSPHNSTVTETPPPRAWTPPPGRKTSWKKRFAPQLIRKGGVALGIIALCGLIPFLLSLFSPGASIPDQSEVESTLKELAGRYEQMVTSADDWKSYGSEVRSTAGEFVKGYRTAAGQCQPRDIELKQAATSLIQLVNCPAGDSKKHKQHLDVFNASLSDNS